MRQYGINCIIIEDDINWKTKLQILLDEIGISIIGVASNVAEAISLLQKHKPCIIIADVILGNEKVFDLFDYDKRFTDIPTIFLTVSDKEIDYKKSQVVKKSLYLVKPVHKLTLKGSIGSLCEALFNKLQQANNSIFIKGKYNERLNISFDKIVYIHQDRHYCTIVTTTHSFRLKKSLSNFLKELDTRFMQVHRSYCINTNYIVNFSVGLENIKLKDMSVAIPIGSTFLPVVKEYISQKNSL